MTLNFTQFINFIPKRPTYVLFGEKLTHSISNYIHSLIFNEYQIDAEYIHVELEKSQLLQALNHLKTYFCGANVTIPYKQDVIPFLDETHITAQKLSSVNTILVQNGKLFGYNTDIAGIYETFSRDNVSLNNKNVCLFGAGATSNVLAHILLENKANLTILARNLDKACLFKKNLLENYPNAVINTGVFEDFTDDYNIIINSTPLGMGEFENLSPITHYKNAQYVFDVVYNPQMTKFLQIAYENDIKYSNGLYMLYMQALFAQNIWNNIDLTQSNNVYEKLSLYILKNKLKTKNIALFGFMGSGKTTIAKELAKLLDFNLIDTDEMIEQRENMSVSDIFATFSEDYFRKLETGISREISNIKNSIISLGGGFVINPENVENIQKSSILVFLNTPFDEILCNLQNDTTRPLLKSCDIKELYEKRINIYQKISNLKISKKNTPTNKALEIIYKI